MFEVKSQLDTSEFDAVKALPGKPFVQANGDGTVTVDEAFSRPHASACIILLSTCGVAP